MKISSHIQMGWVYRSTEAWNIPEKKEESGEGSEEPQAAE